MGDFEKMKVVKEANILLISDKDRDYKDLVDYGFKNIDHFKSIIRADRYFKEHPEELEKYHIIIKGSQKVECNGFHIDLVDKLKEVSVDYPNMVVWLNKRSSGNGDITLYYDNKYTYFNVYYGNEYGEKIYTLFDNIAEYTANHGVMDKVKALGKSNYHDYVNPNKLPLPNKKSDLKILYLYGIMYDEFGEEDVKESGLNEELGLDITFVRDSKIALAENVINKLGDYDIIIAWGRCSGILFHMNDESTEQCKDTGRLFTLLATYNEFPFGIDLSYSFGGEIAKSLEKEHKFFRALSKDDEGHFRGYSLMRSIIESVVSHYDDNIVRLGASEGISGLDLREADDFTAECKEEQERKEQLRELELAPIKAFDEMCSTVKACLGNTRNFYRPSNNYLTINDLRITDLGYSIKLDSVYQGRVLCSLTFPIDHWLDDFRTFELQTLTNKGGLSKPQPMGLYTSEVEERYSLPARPTEKQTEIIESLEKKVATNLAQYTKKDNQLTYKKRRFN